MSRKRKSDAPTVTPVNLVAVAEALGLPCPVPELEFHPVRKWRWDLAWGEPYLVAMERQGATWTGGHHTRGQGYEDDARKLVEGQLLGWLVVPVTPGQLLTGEAWTLVRRALVTRGWTPGKET